MFFRAAIVALALISAATHAIEAAPPDQWNVVFFLADDVGWTDLGCTGSDLYRTPHLDRLAREGMRFTNAYSACTVCSPTRAAVLTGKYPARLHLTDWIAGHNRPFAPLAIPDWTKYLPLEEQTIAEAIAARGYTSGHVGKWHLGPQGFWPTEQGFEKNIAGYDAGAPPSFWWPYERAGRGIPTLQLTAESKGQHLMDRLADETARIIGQWKDRPFFLYLPTYAVHMPIEPRQGDVAAYQARVKPGMKHQDAAYAALVQTMDDYVGRVLAAIDSAGLTERTVVFFTSDNGGLSHIYGDKRGPTDNSPLRAGKGSTYEGGVRVPLIVRWPGVTKPGSLSHEPVISTDYYPTIVEITGAKNSPEAVSDGMSMVPLLRDADGTLARDSIYWHYPHYHPGGATPYGAVRARDWKLIEFYEDRHVELYNLEDDLGETKDLARQLPEKAAQLREELNRWRQSVGAQMPVANPQADAAKDAASIQSRASKKPLQESAARAKAAKPPRQRLSKP